MVDLSKSQEYRSFVSSVPKKKVVADEGGKQEWTFYDAGPRSIRNPVIFLPPASGTADIFFKQILALSAAGYRAIAVEYPPYWTLEEWYSGFQNFLDYLQLDTIHIFGASLGGFLAQKFAEHTIRKRRVASLILCNAFMDTSVFDQRDAARTFWMMPSLFLKKMVMGNFDKGIVDGEIASSIDFMVDKLDSLSQKELASRLTLNCIDSYVEPQLINNQNIPITIIDVFDLCAISESVKQDMYKCYPDAKRAHLKSGGNFPYLSRSDEVALYVKIHLKQFVDSSSDLSGDTTPDTDATQPEVGADDSSVMDGETLEGEGEETHVENL